MTAQVKVRVYGLGLLPPRLNGSLSVTTAPLKAVRASAALYN